MHFQNASVYTFLYFALMYISWIIALYLQIDNDKTDVLTLPKAPVTVAAHYEYAVQVDVRSPVDDFYKRIPQMA